jgi:hypothetical protein
MIAIGWLLFSMAAVPLWKAPPLPWVRLMLLVMAISSGLLAVLYWSKPTSWRARFSGSWPMFCAVACMWLLDHHHL